MAAFFIGYPKSRMQIACATPPLLLAYQLCKQAGLPRRVWLLSAPLAASLLGTFRTDDQLISITLATSPRHSEHKPTSNKSPALTAPEKLLIVTSWRHFPHQTFESSSFLL